MSFYIPLVNFFDKKTKTNDLLYLFIINFTPTPAKIKLGKYIVWVRVLAYVYL